MKNLGHSLHAARLVSVALILMLLAGVIAPFSALDDMDSAASGEHTPEYVIFDGDYIKNDTLSGLNQLTVDYGSAENFTYVSLQPPNYSENDKVDPYVTFSPKEYYSADEYKYISVITRSKALADQTTNFRIYFQAGKDSSYAEARSVPGSYAKTSDWQIVTFDLSTKSSWQGRINKLRLDVYGDKIEDAADIAAVIFSKTPTAVYDSSFDALTDMFPPVQTVADFAADEIDTIITDKNGNTYYLMAVCAARENNLEKVCSSLKSAAAICKKKAANAATDLEFAKFWLLDVFKAAIQ
jgi:hypothetical protein